MEEYEIRFMDLVKYVSYMDNDQRQEERFVYGLKPKGHGTDVETVFSSRSN